MMKILLGSNPSMHSSIWFALAGLPLPLAAQGSAYPMLLTERLLQIRQTAPSTQPSFPVLGKLRPAENQHTFNVLVDGCDSLEVEFEFSDLASVELIDPAGKVRGQHTADLEDGDEKWSASLNESARRGEELETGMWKIRISTPKDRRGDLRYAFNVSQYHPRIQALLFKPGNQVRVGEKVQIHLKVFDTKIENLPLSGLKVRAVYYVPQDSFRMPPALPMMFKETEPGSGDYVATIHATKASIYSLRASVEAVLPGIGKVQRHCIDWFYAIENKKTGDAKRLPDSKEGR